MKKTFLLLLTAVLLSVASAFAQGGTVGPLTWNINNGTLTISGNGAIPDYYTEYAPWQVYEQSITNVVIGDSVTVIGSYSLTLLSQLTSVIIGNSVTHINEGAINRCAKLESVTIPQNVMSIHEQSAFWACDNLMCFDIDSNNLYYASENGVFFNKEKTTLFQYPAGKTDKSYSMPNGVTTIYGDAFFYCYNLTSVTIPESVTTMGFAIGCCGEPIIVSVFRGSTNLISIDVDGNNMTFTSENGILFNKEKTTLLQYPAGKAQTTYNIPSSVTSIGFGAFEHCNHLTSMIIPNTVTTIEPTAFMDAGIYASGTGLTSVTIGSGVTTIGYNAFSYCRDLQSITILNLVPNSISLGSYIFINEGSMWNQGDCNLLVPTNAISEYQNAEVWKEFNIIGGGFLVNPVSENSVYGYTIGDGLYGGNGKSTATVTAVAHTGYKFVNWTKDGVEVSTENPYSFTVTEDVELVANFTNDVGIVETHNCASLRVYPNPTTGVLNIQETMNNEQLTMNNVEVFDIYGRKVISDMRLSDMRYPTSEIGKSEITINISHLPAGIYFLKVGNETVKVVKQ